MTSAETLLALHLTGVVGPRRLKSAKAFFPDLSGLFGTSEERLAALPDWNASSARKVAAFPDPAGRVERELEVAGKFGIRVLVEGEPGFPGMLRDLYDPPFVLWLWGNYLPEDEKAIAVIGCRKPSAYGRQAALRLSEDVARAGYTVVSGLAQESMPRAKPETTV